MASKTTYGVKYVFNTETEGKTMTKTFTDYNTEITDDVIRTAGKTIAAQGLFADDDNSAITSVKTLGRMENKYTPIDLEAL